MFGLTDFSCSSVLFFLSSNNKTALFIRDMDITNLPHWNFLFGSHKKDFWGMRNLRPVTSSRHKHETWGGKVCYIHCRSVTSWSLLSPHPWQIQICPCEKNHVSIHRCQYTLGHVWLYSCLHNVSVALILAGQSQWHSSTQFMQSSRLTFETWRMCVGLKTICGWDRLLSFVSDDDQFPSHMLASS